MIQQMRQEEVFGCVFYFPTHYNNQSHKSSVMRICWTFSSVLENNTYLLILQVTYFNSHFQLRITQCIYFPQTHGCQLFIRSILTALHYHPLFLKSCIALSIHLLYQYKQQTESKHSRDYLKFFKNVRRSCCCCNL